MATFILVLKLLPDVIYMAKQAIALGESLMLEATIASHAKELNTKFNEAAAAKTDAEAAAAAGGINDIFRK